MIGSQIVFAGWRCLRNDQNQATKSLDSFHLKSSVSFDFLSSSVGKYKHAKMPNNVVPGAIVVVSVAVAVSHLSSSTSRPVC